MANLRDIRRRIKSVKNTRQITRAMQLVASSKMKRAQDTALAGRPYASLLVDLLDTLRVELAARELKVSHPLVGSREVNCRGILVFSTDKGLCGPLNTNLFRRISDEVTTPAKFGAVGRKAAQFLQRTQRQVLGEFIVSDQVSYAEVAPIVARMIDAYMSGEVDTVEILFPAYRNILLQEPTFFPLLPIADFDKVLSVLRSFAGGTFERPAERREMLFEPSLEEVLRDLPALYAKEVVHQLLLESKASEYSARMVAMKAATDNATNLVDDLTLDYNKARQAAITQEIVEIAAAAGQN